MRKKKAIYNVLTNLLLQIIYILYGFIVPKIIISKFGSNINGLVTSITQFLAYISLLESGFGPVVKAALYKPLAKKDNKTVNGILKTADKFFKTISMIFIAYIMVLCIFYPLIVNKNFDYFFTISLIIIISISTFAEYFFGMTIKLLLQADQKTYIISLIQIFTYILSIIAIVIMAYLNLDILMIKLVSGIIFVLRPIIQNIYVKKHYNLAPFDSVKEYPIKNKWDGLAQHIAAVIHNNTDVTVLTFFCTLEEISVYSIYYLVVKGLKSLIQAFNNGIDAIFGDMIAKNEKENLNNKFNLYEIIYFSIVTVVFSSAMVLIVPFVEVYTNGVTDANYIRPLFGYLIVISEFIWAIRLPYSSITLAAGHFKETRIGAWVECISNILISILLVKSFGIVGVAIGTIVAMAIRTIEFIYHTSKYILNRNLFLSIKKILAIVLDVILINLSAIYIPMLNNNSYFNWLINAIIIALGATIITILIDCMFYNKEIKQILEKIKIGGNRKKWKHI